MVEIIRRVNGYDHNAYTYYPVLIVGAGMSGLAMACRLKDELGFDQFRIFDRQAGIGGTWWINRYPGAACDVPAVFYSFSFKQNPKWTTFYPPGREIVQYYHEVCESYNITDKVELNTDVEQCTWLEQEQLWEVKLRRMVAGMGDLSWKDRTKVVQEQGEDAVYAGSETVRAKIVVSCVGGLVEPKGWPDEIPGIEKFKGSMFHSARWDESVDFQDKNVVVIGTGCSSAQLVPRLINAPYEAKSVTQLMRTPPWVAPPAIPPRGDEWWENNSKKLLARVPGLKETLRFIIALAAEVEFLQLFRNTKFSQKQRAMYERDQLARMKKMVPEKYHEMLTPDYGVGCKRRIWDKRWYSSLNDPRIELTTQPFSRVKESSVVIGPGVCYPKNATSELPEREIPADVIVLANGFETTRWLHPLKVAGRGGKDLVETMDERGGSQAYLGTALDGFPNCFLIFGPNTATGHTSVVMTCENQVNYALRFIKPVLDGDVSLVEVKKEAEMAYTEEMQAASKQTVFGAGGCKSWYQSDDGWNSSTYPYTQVDFWYRCRFPKWSDWVMTYTQQGLARQRRKRILRMLAMLILLISVFRVRQRGVDLYQMKSSVLEVLQGTVSRLAAVLALLKARGISISNSR